MGIPSFIDSLEEGGIKVKHILLEDLKYILSAPSFVFMVEIVAE